MTLVHCCSLCPHRPPSSLWMAIGDIRKPEVGRPIDRQEPHPPESFSLLPPGALKRPHPNWLLKSQQHVAAPPSHAVLPSWS